MDKSKISSKRGSWVLLKSGEVYTIEAMSYTIADGILSFYKEPAGRGGSIISFPDGEWKLSGDTELIDKWEVKL